MDQSERETSESSLTDILAISKSRILAVVLLICLSMLNKYTIGPLEIAGGQALIGIAAVILLWPMIKYFAARGGSTEIFGLKLQLNALEQKSAEQYEVRIQELKTDIEELRKQMASSVEIAETNETEQIQDSKAETAFLIAVNDYNMAQKYDDWRKRVLVDRRLASGVGRLTVNRLKELRTNNLENQGFDMALAVSLGYVSKREDEAAAVKMLIKLLSSNYERVRFRAARSVQRRLERSDISNISHQMLSRAIKTALDKETAQIIIGALDDASRAADYRRFRQLS